MIYWRISALVSLYYFILFLFDFASCRTVAPAMEYYEREKPRLPGLCDEYKKLMMSWSGACLSETDGYIYSGFYWTCVNTACVKRLPSFLFAEVAFNDSFKYIVGAQCCRCPVQIELLVSPGNVEMSGHTLPGGYNMGLVQATQTSLSDMICMTGFGLRSDFPNISSLKSANKLIFSVEL